MVGVWIELVDREGRSCRALPDPAGGTFDAAGDFDRLLVPSPELPVWSTIDTEGNTWLDATRAGLLANEVLILLQQARPGPEERGLQRLAVLASRAAAEGLRLRCVGD